MTAAQLRWFALLTLLLLTSSTPSVSAQESAKFKVINDTNQPLKILWIGPNNREREYGTITPGEEANGVTTIGQRFILRNAVTGQMVRLIEIVEPEDTWRVRRPGEAPKSRRGDPALLNVANRTSLPLAISWMNGANEEPIGSLGAGESRTLNTTVGHTIRFRSPDGDEAIPAHTMTLREEEISITRGSSLQAPRPNPLPQPPMPTRPNRRQRPMPMPMPMPMPEPNNDPGPPPPGRRINVPSFGGMTIDEASTQPANGLAIKLIAVGAPPTPDKAGTIVFQRPPGGAEAPAGSTVTLYHFTAANQRPNPRPAPRPDPRPNPTPTPAVVTTYWLGRKGGPDNGQLIYDVRVPDYFLQWMQEKTSCGGGTRYERTINGVSYVFTKQTFSWDTNRSGSNPARTGQIGIRTDLQLGLDWKYEERLRSPEASQLRSALDSLASDLNGNPSWKEARAVTIVETRTETPPDLAISTSTLFDTADSKSEHSTFHAEKPQILVIPHNGSFFAAWQKYDSGVSKGPMLARFDVAASGNGYSKAWEKNLSLELLGGFAMEPSNGGLYVLTTNKEDLGSELSSTTYRRGIVELSRFDLDGNEVWRRDVNSVEFLGEPVDGKYENAIFSPMIDGTGSLEIGGGKLLISVSSNSLPDYGISSRHQGARYIVTDLDGNGLKTVGGPSWRHSFDQRVRFDGTDFVFMDLGDAGWFMPGSGITVRKIKPTDSGATLPENLEGTYIYARLSDMTQGSNSTFTSMGDILPGKDGYVALFSSERNNDTSPRDSFSQPVLEPRNLGLVHVARDFDQVRESRWGGPSAPPRQGNVIINESSDPVQINITRSVVDSDGETVSVVRPDKPAKSFIRTGIVWLTNYSTGISVERPKLLPVGDNQFACLWEEWSYLGANLTYQSTQAMLVDERGSVLKPARPINARLCPNGADRTMGPHFVSGDSGKNTITVYTVNPELEVTEVILHL
jgi:hypothetical protein